MKKLVLLCIICTLHLMLFGQYTVNGDEVWTTPPSNGYQGGIYINQGASLSIRCDLEFNPGTYIVVSTEAKLKISSNATLSGKSANGYAWEGIEVLGNGNTDQAVSNLSQGMLICSYGTTIRGASIGVYAESGAIVRAFGTHFMDCRIGAYFEEYNNPSRPDFNLSQFKDCQFTFDLSGSVSLKYRDPFIHAINIFDPYHFNNIGVFLDNSTGVSILGCEFKNLGSTKDGMGIFAYNSSFTVQRDALSTYYQLIQSSCSPMGNKGIFENLYYGIKLYGTEAERLSKDIHINECLFIENIYGVHCTQDENIQLYKNEFINSVPYSYPNSECFHVYTHACFKVDILAHLCQFEAAGPTSTTYYNLYIESLNPSPYYPVQPPMFYPNLNTTDNFKITNNTFVSDNPIPGPNSFYGLYTDLWEFNQIDLDVRYNEVHGGYDHGFHFGVKLDQYNPSGRLADIGSLSRSAGNQFIGSNTLDIYSLSSVMTKYYTDDVAPGNPNPPSTINSLYEIKASNGYSVTYNPTTVDPCVIYGYSYQILPDPYVASVYTHKNVLDISCVNIAEIFEDGCVYNSDPGDEGNITLSPNPTDDHFDAEYEINDPFSNAAFRIYTTANQLMFEQVLTDQAGVLNLHKNDLINGGVPGSYACVLLVDGVIIASATLIVL